LLVSGAFFLAFAWAQNPFIYVCAIKLTTGLYSPDWSPGVAGTAMSASEGRKAGLCGDALQIKNIGYKLENL